MLYAQKNSNIIFKQSQNLSFEIFETQQDQAAYSNGVFFRQSEVPVWSNPFPLQFKLMFAVIQVEIAKVVLCPVTPFAAHVQNRTGRLIID